MSDWLTALPYVPAADSALEPLRKAVEFYRDACEQVLADGFYQRTAPGTYEEADRWWAKFQREARRLQSR